MHHRTRVVVIALLVLCSSHAAGAASKEMQILQSDMDELQRQVFDMKRLLEAQNEDVQRLVGAVGGGELRQELAAFNANVDALRGEIRQLATRFDETSARLGALERRIQDARAGAAPEAVPGALPPGTDPGAPSAPFHPDGVVPDGSAAPGGPAVAPAGDAGQALFQQAYADYLKDSFELADAEFRDYIRKYPASDLADNAQYWIVMSAFNRKKYEDAVREADQLLGIYPRSENASAVLYRKGLALTKLNRLGQAVLVFNDVTTRYPESPAAAQAAERLKEMAAGE